MSFPTNWTLLSLFSSPPAPHTVFTEAVAACQDNWIIKDVLTDRTGEIVF